MTADSPAPPEQAPSKRRLAAMPLSELTSAHRNPQGHDIPLLKRLIAKFGVVATPILDERTGRLVAGHGRVETLRQQQAEHPDSPPDGIDLRADGEWLVPVLRGWSSRSDEEAEAYLLADNHSTAKGGQDERLLAEMLADATDVGLLEFTAYDADELDALEKGLRAAADDAANAGAPGSADLLDPPDEDQYDSKFGVIVECADAAEQEDVYERLRELGYSCRVVTV